MQKIRVRFLIRRSIRYLLVSHGFRLIQAVVVLAVLSFVLTGSRIAEIDSYGNRADIVATILVTVITVALLTALNRRVKTSIDKRFFREAYDSQMILTELGEAIPTLSKTSQLVELVADKLLAALHPENVTIFLNDEREGTYVAAVSFQASSTEVVRATDIRGFTLKGDTGLIKQLQETRNLGSVDLSDMELSPKASGHEGSDTLSEHERNVFHYIGSSLLIPVSSNGHLLGLISLGRRLSDLPYEHDDKRLLLVVAGQIAAFIENMKMVSRMAREQRLAREIEMATEVQRHLFPADGLEDSTLDIYGTCLPALGVGGDYYDYFELDGNRTGVAIADVAGKGIAAALLMSTVQASLRCQMITGRRYLSDVVGSMNQLLRKSTGDGGYATFFLAEFDKATNDLTYVNAGHNPPMLVRADSDSQGETSALAARSTANGRIQQDEMVETSAGCVGVTFAEQPTVSLLTVGGPIIGTFLNGPYFQETIPVKSGDVLVIYTDGVTEAENPAGMEFGEEQLRTLLLESQGLTARESALNVIDKVLAWQGNAAQHDDITLIVARVK